MNNKYILSKIRYKNIHFLSLYTQDFVYISFHLNDLSCDHLRQVHQVVNLMKSLQLLCFELYIICPYSDYFYVSFLTKMISISYLTSYRIQLLEPTCLSETAKRKRSLLGISLKNFTNKLS